MFKIGTKVVRVRKNTKKYVWTVIGYSNVFTDNCICDYKDEPLYHFHKDELREATECEKLLGERIDK